MTAAHKEMLAGFVDGGKLFSFEELSQEGEVADPYGGDSADYLAVEMQLRRGMDKILEKAKKMIEEN